MQTNERIELSDEIGIAVVRALNKAGLTPDADDVQAACTAIQTMALRALTADEIAIKWPKGGASCK